MLLFGTAGTPISSKGNDSISGIRLAQAFCDFDIQGTVISESPNLEDDALVLKEEYDSIKK